MNFFSDTHITVIRKQDGMYNTEDITTVPVLPAGKLIAEQNRKNTISRLRKDPSVIFVLEERDGRCEEHTVLENGFEMTVSTKVADTRAASILVFYEGNVVCNLELSEEEGEEDSAFFTRFLVEIKSILFAIDRRDYYFVDGDCPFFEEKKPDHALSLYDVYYVLDKAGYQREEIQVPDSFLNPCLFVHENDIVLVGSKRFAGESLFVEMKRPFVNRRASVVEKAVAKFQEDSAIEVIPWYDGSWSFRLPFEEDPENEDTLEQILSIVSTLKEFIRKVERQGELYESGAFEMEQIRHYFIYENIDTALKLSRLPI